MTTASISRASPRATYGRGARPPAALRELLEATLEWAGGEVAPRVLEADGVRYRLTHLADGAAGAAAMLCESAPDAPIPAYADRRRIRGATGGAAGRQLMIFTDAAHSSLVWTWTALGHGGIRAYRELSFRPGEAWGPLRPVLESIAAGSGPASDRAPHRTGSRGRGPEPTGAVHARDSGGSPSPALLSAVSEALRAGPSAAYRRRLQAVQEVIEAAGGAAEIRNGWSLLLELRALDDACGDGAWLERALRTIAAAYDALLERIRSEVDDLDRRRPRPRAERMGDLRRLVRRAGPRRDATLSSPFATEMAMLHNVFGEDTDADLVQRCRARLAAVLVPPAPPGMLELNVRGRAPGRGTVEPPEVVARGVAAILDAHLRAEIDPAELGRAMASAARLLTAGSGALRPSGRVIGREPCRP